MSAFVWQIVNTFIVPLPFLSFILIEVLIAFGEFFTKFALNKAEGKPTNFQKKKDAIHTGKNPGD